MIACVNIANMLSVMDLGRRRELAVRPRSEAIGIDARVLAFGIVMTALTAVVAGVLPAIHVARTRPRQVMDASEPGSRKGPPAAMRR